MKDHSWACLPRTLRGTLCKWSWSSRCPGPACQSLWQPGGRHPGSREHNPLICIGLDCWIHFMEDKIKGKSFWKVRLGTLSCLSSMSAFYIGWQYISCDWSMAPHNEAKGEAYFCGNWYSFCHSSQAPGEASFSPQLWCILIKLLGERDANPSRHPTLNTNLTYRDRRCYSLHSWKCALKTQLDETLNIG